MTNPYGPTGGNDPQQWGQQPYPGSPSGGMPQPGGGYGQPAPGGFDPNAGQYGGQLGQYGGQPGQYGGYDPSAGPQSGGFGVPGQPYGGYPQQQPQPGFDPNSGQFGQPGQFGAPPQQPGQFGAPGPQQFGGFPPQPGFDPNQPFGANPQFGQFPGGPQGAAPTKSKAPLLFIGGGVVALVLLIVLVGGFVWPGFFMSTVFDQAKLQSGVQQILTQEYRIDGVSDVKCPSGQKVSPGTTFNCQVTVGGQQKNVVVTIKNAQGVYEVAKPS